MIKNRVIQAYNFAQQKHSGQIRKFSQLPYFVHPKGVARIIEDLCKDEEMIICALLHDVVEDCNVSLYEINDEFGATVAEIVNQLSKKEDDQRPKIEYLCDAVYEMTPKAFTIKLADRYDNVRFLEKDCNTVEHKKFVKKYYKETRELLIFIEKNKLAKTKVQKLLVSMINCQMNYIKVKYLWD